MTHAIRVLITGAAGQIAYNLSNMVANGNMFGKDHKVILHLFDIPQMETVLNGVVMELQDCAFPKLEGIVATTDIAVAFKDIDVALMVGAMPRKEGMERKDLLAANVSIFKTQGEALDKYAKKTVKVLVVGNPANTNSLMMSKYAPSIPKKNFSALTRLDHNRAVSQVAMKTGVGCSHVKNVIIWGNHSNTQFPDISHAVVTDHHGKSTPAPTAINDADWISKTFIPCVQKRGAAVIAARKMSSAASAAKSIVDHMHDWWFGTKEGEHVSMAVYSNGEYGAPKDVIFSFPVTIKDKEYKIVEGLTMSEADKVLFGITAKELVEERESATAVCK